MAAPGEDAFDRWNVCAALRRHGPAGVETLAGDDPRTIREGKVCIIVVLPPQPGGERGEKEANPQMP